MSKHTQIKSITIVLTGVDAPKPGEVETSMQLPTSSSNSEKQPCASTPESKPGMKYYTIASTTGKMMMMMMMMTMTTMTIMMMVAVVVVILMMMMMPMTM